MVADFAQIFEIVSRSARGRSTDSKGEGVCHFVSVENRLFEHVQFVNSCVKYNHLSQLEACGQDLRTS